MSKESFYFPHDYNARTDRKLVSVIMKHGMLGIGIYWCLIEMLYEEGGYLPLEYERITFELRTETTIIQSIINDFELFQINNNKFWSDAVLERLNKRCEKSEKARQSINKRWDKLRQNKTTFIRTKYDSNTIKERKGKENKEKNIKREKNIIPPPIELVAKYCQERNNMIDPNVFWDWNTAKGWVIGKEKMKDWQAAIRTWEKRDRQPSKISNTSGSRQTGRTSMRYVESDE